MLGPYKRVFRVRRWSLRCEAPYSLWECDYVCIWPFYKKITLPLRPTRCSCGRKQPTEHDDRDIHWRISHALRREFQYLRRVEVVSTELHFPLGWLSPHCYVVGWDKCDRNACDTARYVRRIWFLTTRQGDGVTNAPDDEGCVSPWGYPEIYWSYTRRLSQAAEAFRVEAITEIQAALEGRTVAASDHNLKRVWITPAEQDRRNREAQQKK
jgi:hypothetical protein